MFKDTWHDPVWSAVIAGLIVLAVAGAATWFWRGLMWRGEKSSVPQKITSVLIIVAPPALLWWRLGTKLTDWLTTKVELTRSWLIMLVVFPLIMGFAVGPIMLWWQRRKTVVEPAVKPEVPAKVAVEAFKWSELRGLTLTVLLDRYGQRTDLDQLYALVRPASENMRLISTAHIAREMEAAERASIVRIDRLGETVRYYYLTDHGRDWLLDMLAVRKPA
jgi:hypothetical protein